MRAPVYRNLDARSTFLGLAFPAEWMAVLAAGWLGTAFGAPNVGAATGLAIYLVLRIAGYGRPDGHLQHWLLWKVRQLRARGRLSSAARAPVPRFPHVTASGSSSSVSKSRGSTPRAASCATSSSASSPPWASTSASATSSA